MQSRHPPVPPALEVTMSNPTIAHRPHGSRIRQLEPGVLGTWHRYGSKRRDAAYAARVDYTFGLMALRSR
jgi:hypothetical protein